MDSCEREGTSPTSPLTYSKLKQLDYQALESNLYWESHYWARPYPTHDRDSLQKEINLGLSKVDKTHRYLANK